MHRLASWDIRTPGVVSVDTNEEVITCAYIDDDDNNSVRRDDAKHNPHGISKFLLGENAIVEGQNAGFDEKENNGIH